MPVQLYSQMISPTPRLTFWKCMKKGCVSHTIQCGVLEIKSKVNQKYTQPPSPLGRPRPRLTRAFGKNLAIGSSFAESIYNFCFSSNDEAFTPSNNFTENPWKVFFDQQPRICQKQMFRASQLFFVVCNCCACLLSRIRAAEPTNPVCLPRIAR